MKHWLLTLFAATFLAISGANLGHSQTTNNVYAEITWDELLPPKWASEIKLQMSAISRLSFLVDGSKEADAAMARLRDKWDSAPIDRTYINRPIRIAGYVVTLDANKTGITEFLLVPYFGACIHLPPPPANQIILIRLRKPTTKLASMDTVWVKGTLRDSRVSTSAGVTGYVLEEAESGPLKEKKQSLRTHQ